MLLHFAKVLIARRATTFGKVDFSKIIDLLAIYFCLTIIFKMTRIKLTFIVYGDMFDIDEFSKIINISPTEFAYKGDKLKFRISTDTFWKYSFKDIISLFVEDSLKPLEKIITPRIEEIASFMQKNNLKSIMRFKVETNKEPAPAIAFENNTINLLSKLNSSIDLDLYIYD